MSDLWRPFDADFISNPYPVYRQLRERHSFFQSQHSEWVFMRYAEVKAIIKDPRFRVGNRVEWLRQISTQQNPPLFGNLLEAISSFLLFKNDLDHTQLRRFITHAWRDKDVTELINKNITFLTREIDWQKFDFAREIAEPLPALTMAGILGVPVEEYPFLVRHSRTMIRSLDTYLTLRDLRAMEDSTRELAAFYKSVLEEKKRKPDNSLMSRMLESSQRYSLDEISYSCIFLFISGEETTAALLSLGLYHLIKHDKWGGLTPAAITEPMVDEMIRFDPPTQIIARYNPDYVSVSGLDLEPNSRITLCLASANRDSAVFEKPDELLFDREVKHLSFGYGFHHCLGDWLAKAEAMELWRYLRAHFQEINLVEEIQLRQNLTLRNVESMYISCRS